EVLQVIKDEKLQENALKVGMYLKDELIKLQKEFPILRDVRGQEMLLCFELTVESIEPLAENAACLVKRLKDYRILMSSDGKDNNALKIKPPMVFSIENANELLERLKQIFQEDFMKF